MVRSNVPLNGYREAVELLRDADGLPDVEVDWQLRDPELGVGAARIVGVDDAAQLQIDRRVARDIDAAIDPGIHVRDVERRHQILGVLRPGAGDVGGERVTLPVRAHDQFRRGDDISGGRTAGYMFGIGAGGARKVERGKQYERAGADAERRVRIRLGQDRQQALRPLPERKGIGRLQVRRWRVGDIVRQVAADRVGVKLRPWRRQTAAGAIGGRERMNLGRRIVDKLLLQRRRWRRQSCPDPHCGAQRIDLRRRHFDLLRSRWRSDGRVVGRHRRECRLRRLRHDRAEYGRWCGLFAFGARDVGRIEAGIGGAQAAGAAVGRGRADPVRRECVGRRWLLGGGPLLPRLAKTRQRRRIALQRRLQQIGACGCQIGGWGL